VNKKKIKKAVKERKKRLTAEERAEFARQRQSLEGNLITQTGEFYGAMVIEHIRGSQYKVRLVDGTEVYASHKKPKPPLGPAEVASPGFSHSGWKLWR
tara:strand:- start:45675 stop:45968 length:294 start_codon:yes stop_codon:yes gene_type:complete